MTRNALLISGHGQWQISVAVTHYITVGPARLLWVLVTDTPNPGHQCDHFLCSCRTFFSLVKDQNGSTKHKTEIVFGITVSFIHYVIQCVWTSIVHHRHLHCFIIGDDKVKWSTKHKIEKKIGWRGKYVLRRMLIWTIIWNTVEMSSKILII